MRLGNAAVIASTVAVCGFVALDAQESPTKLDTLRVEAVSRIDPNLPATTRSVQLLTAEELGSLPVRTISEMLEWATGVDMLSRSPAQSDLSIRGAGFEQVVVLVNGVRMSDPQTGHFDLDLAVPLEAVERIEILRGAASALYGADAMGGVVNVVTRTHGDAFVGSVQGGSWRTVRVSGSAVTGGGGAAGPSLFAGGEVARSDGHRSGTDYDNAQLHLALSSPSGGGQVKGELGASRRDFGAQDFYAPYPSFERTRLYTASLGWESEAAGRLAWEARLSARRHDDEFILVREDPSVYRNQHTSSQGGATVLGRYSIAQQVNVAFGGELFWDDLSSSSLGQRTERRAALIAEALIGRAGSAVLSVGTRADWHEGFGAFFSPSISGSLVAGSGFNLRAALGRSFRAPSWTERYYSDPVNVGRPDLSPERAWSAELGADLLRIPGITVSATAFVRRATSLIDWARPLDAQEADPWETRNVEDATFRGVEADIELSGPLGFRWILGGTAVAVDVEDVEGFRSKYALRPLREQLTVGVRRSFGSYASARLGVRHARRQGEDSYRRLDLRLSLRVGPGWLYLDALNLTNFAYPDVTGALAPGRAAFVGYRLGRK